MEKEKIDRLNFLLDLLETDHKEKTKRYAKKNLLSADNVESSWLEVAECLDEIILLPNVDNMGNDEFNQLPTEKKQKAMKMIMAELDEFGEQLERSILIDKFAPQILAGLVSRVTKNSTGMEVNTMVNRSMEFARVLASACMAERPAAAKYRGEHGKEG